MHYAPTRYQVADDSATDTRDGHDEHLPDDTNSLERDQNLTDFGYTFPGNKRKVLERAFHNKRDVACCAPYRNR